MISYAYFDVVDELVENIGWREIVDENLNYRGLAKTKLDSGKRLKFDEIVLDAIRLVML